MKQMIELLKINLIQIFVTNSYRAFLLFNGVFKVAKTYYF